MEKKEAPFPVYKGQLIETAVSGIASSGDGHFTVDGYTIFVPGAISGDRALLKVVKTTPGFGVCSVEKIISESPARTTPHCKYYEQCGGCQLQHLSYSNQIQFKKDVVIDSLERIGKLSIPEEINTIPSSRAFSYRSRGIFAVGKKGRDVKVGFYKKKSHEIIDIEQCPVLLPPINTILTVIRSLLGLSDTSIYNEETHKGVLRKIVIRGSLSTGKFLVGFVTNSGRLPEELIRGTAELNQKFAGELRITGIVQNINTHKNNIILGNRNNTLWGSPVFSDKIGGLEYLMSLTSFFQVNPLQMAHLNDTVADFLGDTKTDILDAYCGNGSISLWLSRNGNSVTGVEENCNAISDAVKSAKKNSIKSCSFACSTMEKFLQPGKTRYQAIILNPPRGGCSVSVLNSVIKSSPEKIVYVSCKPSTLARDLKKLCYEGYALQKISIIDMFPQTIHMETVVLLQKPDGAS